MKDSRRISRATSEWQKLFCANMQNNACRPRKIHYWLLTVLGVIDGLGMESWNHSEQFDAYVNPLTMVVNKAKTSLGMIRRIENKTADVEMPETRLR